MAKESKKALVPKLRFPEFRGSQLWQHAKLGELGRFTGGGTPSKENPSYWMGDNPWVSSSDISEESIHDIKVTRYISDAATRETATRLVPANSVLLVSRVGVGKLAVTSKPIYTSQDFTSFTPDKDNLLFVAYYLKSLKKTFLAFNQGMAIKGFTKDDASNLGLYLPRLEEQQNIADCLTSLDELIAAQGRKVEALKTYKRGLMQQLFPREGETLPRLRFPEFRDAPEWEEAPLGDLFDTSSGGTPDRTKREYWNGHIPWVTTSLVDFNFITKAEEFISEAGLDNSSAKVFPKGAVLIAMYGQGITRGKVAMLGTPAATNQACAAILPNDEIDSGFTFVSLCGRYEEMRRLSNSGGQENLSQALIRALPFRYPKDVEEQTRIVECFSEIDALIVGEVGKLDALKLHKDGLMQQLFPSVEETK